MKVHVMPLDDTDTHYTYIPCWCSPLEMQPNLFVHHAIDLREIRERQGRPDRDKKWIVVEVPEIFEQSP